MSPSPKPVRNALILLAVISFPLAGLGILFYFRASSEKRVIAEPAIYQAAQSAQVADLIGLPMQPGWPIKGSFVRLKTSGNADLQIPLSGPKGAGTLSEWAQKSGESGRSAHFSFAPTPACP